MNVRPAEDRDIPKIISMGRKFWAQTAFKDIVYCPDSIAESAREMMANGLLLVVEEGEVVGAVGAVMAPLYANRSVMIASELYWWIEPEYRDSGAGKLLLRGIEQAAKDRGITVFAMMALEAVEPEKAAAIYQRLGYVPSERTFQKRL